MSFISALKSAFGFGPDSEYDPETADDPEFAAGDNSDSGTADTADSDGEAGLHAVPTLPEIDPEMKARIFEGAVAIFNEALPDFLSRSVDPAAQRRRLAEALDKGVDDYLSSLMLRAEQYAEGKLKESTDAARRESERLKSDIQQIEQQRTNLREQQLSADRRRRALADRVNDLEAQLAAAEAEREQYQLENRSLLNKLKVADIQPGVVDEMAKEIESLKAALADAKSGAAPADGAVAADSEALTQAIARAEAAEEARAKAEASVAEAVAKAEASAQEAIAKAEADAKAAGESAQEAAARAEASEKELADIRTQYEMGQAMYNDIQNKFAAERDARADVEKQLDDARKLVEGMDEVQQQMEKVVEVVRKRDERIARLKAANKKLTDQLQAAEARVRRAVSSDSGLFALAADDDDEPDTKPEAEPEAEKQPKEAEAPRRKSTAAAITPDQMAAIEDEFECPDWFVSEPLPGEVSPLLMSDSEFGYQEPPKKPHKPENDAQLSLF